MRRILILTCKLALASFLVVLTTNPALAEDIPTGAYKNSVVAIFSKAEMDNGEIESSSGSGFVISKEGDILTALHVTGDPELYSNIKIDVYFPTNQDRAWRFKGPYSGSIIDTYPPYDLALIRLQDTSFLSTVPVLALGFSNSMDEESNYKGYGYNLLRSPADRTAPHWINASYAAPANDLPFEIFQESSFNFGASGGPLLTSSTKLVAAVWHGRISKFISIDNQERPVHGLSWVIPMNSHVKDWLTKNSVAFRNSPPTYDKLNYTNGIANVKINQSEINTTSNSGGYVTAPPGSTIVSAELELNKKILQCSPTNGMAVCETITKIEKKALEVDSGRIAYIREPSGSSANINLTLKPSDEFYNNVEFLSIELRSQPGSADPSEQLVSFHTEKGKELLAASVTIDANLENITTEINKGAFAVSKIPERRAGIPGVLYRTFWKEEEIGEASQNVLNGTATLVIGNKGQKIDDTDIKQILDSTLVIPPSFEEGSFETKIIKP